MSYGAITMPSNYVVMEQEEMMYIDGGWSGTVFKNNMLGLYNGYRNAAAALRMGGITLGTIYGMGKMSAAFIVAKYGVTISTTASIVGGIVAGVIAALSITAAVAYLGNKRVFY
ncbi:MAG: hypothetical protein GX660_01340 [Clostridiaceae bacterium]|nr:hypothetical protein [Clostridiaceae bacterium]